MELFVPGACKAKSFERVFGIPEEHISEQSWVTGSFFFRIISCFLSVWIMKKFDLSIDLLLFISGIVGILAHSEEYFQS